ncbi:hypothetical protein TNCV_2843151 [Trichonephila clavipes]|nr:hypothetical protein TNCV_2843151 [Trichonephila clavipes]
MRILDLHKLYGALSLYVESSEPPGLKPMTPQWPRVHDHDHSVTAAIPLKYIPLIDNGAAMLNSLQHSNDCEERRVTLSTEVLPTTASFSVGY